jgi:hypothetical protein
MSDLAADAGEALEASKVGHFLVQRFLPFLSGLQIIGSPLDETPVAPEVEQNEPGWTTLPPGAELGFGTDVVDGASGGGDSTAAGPVKPKGPCTPARVGLSVADAGAVAPQPISRFAMASCSAWVTQRP